MTTTISKGRLFRCTVAVDDDRLRAMKRAPELADKALMAGADYWHTGILPQHFKTPARGTYGYAPRSKSYRNQAGKKGKPDLIFSGSLRRELIGGASFQRVGGSIALKMRARVLNLAPTMPENSEDLYVRHKRGRGYPNLKREIKALTPDDREAVAVVVARELERLFDPSGNQTPTSTTAEPGGPPAIA